MTYLVSISIGPVQDFIAAARKTRDLWAGSYLLSEISRAAAQALADKQCQLVYPSRATVVNRDLSIPNKILAIAPQGSSPADLAKEASNAAEEKLFEFLDAALEKVRTEYPEIDVKVCQSQVETFLELYAAWWPMKDGNLVEAREQVEELMAGRKALRDFAQSASSAGVPKSSLDPGRDAVLDGRKVREHRTGQEHNLDIKQGEMLDAISLTKRFGPAQRFVSTARVAADPLIRRMKGSPTLEELRGLAEEMLKQKSQLCTSFSPESFPQYAEFPYDTSLFFSEGREEVAEDPAKDLVPDFTHVLGRFLRDNELPSQLPAYYAILAADGDNMGKVVSEKACSGGLKELEEFSKVLSKFSANVREIVENQHNGALVYGGGDDVLAFLPLDRALPCANALRQEFSNLTGCTMSVGIAIAHYAAPLQTAVRWAREAERDAKAQSGKNALAVHLHTRTAGEEHIAARHSWDDDPVNRWDLWTTMLDERKLPSQAAYHLRQLACEFNGIMASDVLYKEAERILKRKRADSGTEELDQDAVANILRFAGGKNNMSAQSLHGAVNEILIARKIVPALTLTRQKGEQE
ncbi:MAG: type III-B CRISPR-associated protein Cas10/Cmr2 [Armatimonadota bacterium]|nr:MAG: type III-B CRISPR-associated protein Cas10/Cmr2 [Armatimonadota bacterium]